MIVEVSLHARTTFLTLSPEVFYIILALRSKSSHPYPLVFLPLFLRPILRTKPRIRYAHDSLNARHCRSFRCCFTLKFAAAILSDQCQTLVHYYHCTTEYGHTRVQKCHQQNHRICWRARVLSKQLRSHSFAWLASLVMVRGAAHRSALSVSPSPSTVNLTT